MSGYIKVRLDASDLIFKSTLGGGAQLLTGLGLWNPFKQYWNCFVTQNNFSGHHYTDATMKEKWAFLPPAPPDSNSWIGLLPVMIILSTSLLFSVSFWLSSPFYLVTSFKIYACPTLSLWYSASGSAQEPGGRDKITPWTTEMAHKGLFNVQK